MRVIDDELFGLPRLVARIEAKLRRGATKCAAGTRAVAAGRLRSGLMRTTVSNTAMGVAVCIYAADTWDGASAFRAHFDGVLSALGLRPAGVVTDLLHVQFCQLRLVPCMPYRHRGAMLGSCVVPKVGRALRRAGTTVSPHITESNWPAYLGANAASLYRAAHAHPLYAAVVEHARRASDRPSRPFRAELRQHREYTLHEPDPERFWAWFALVYPVAAAPAQLLCAYIANAAPAPCDLAATEFSALAAAIIDADC